MYVIDDRPRGIIVISIILTIDVDSFKNMAEKPKSGDAEAAKKALPSSGPKTVENPAFRMMGTYVHLLHEETIISS